MINRSTLTCAILLATAGLSASSAQPPLRALSLFSPPVPAATQPSATTAADGRSTRTRIAHVVHDAVQADRLLLNLFDDVAVEATRRPGGAGEPGLWAGQVDGEPLSAVTFVQDGGILQGAVRSAAGSFSIEPIGDGPAHVIRQLDPRVVPEELPPLVPPALPPADGSAADRPQDDGGTIDVLVVYTAGARRQAGGSEAAVRARIALGIAETNTAYANSGVSHRLRLVGTELTGYTESGDLSLDLRRLTDDADGAMDPVHARRDAAGADLVQLIVGDAADGACGIAWLMQNRSFAFAPFAFSVTAYPCISPNYTFGHELTHNMGSAHAPEDPNSAAPVAPYAYGYKEPSGLFRTVMAYDCPAGCPRVLHFSNPAVAYAGKSTGSSTRHNNALALNQSALTVANFRQARVTGTAVSAPQSFSLDATGTTVTLAWRPPASGVPTGYVVEVGTEEGLANVGSAVVPASTLTFVQPRVPPGTYHVRMRAVDGNGPGPPSPSIPLLMTSSGRCIAAPGAPRLLAPEVSGTDVRLTWTAPPAGGAISRYIVGVGARPGAHSTLIEAGTATSLARRAAPGVYFVRVAGVNACGPGTPSNEVSVTVGPQIPGPPSGLFAGISVNREVTLGWAAPTAGGPVRQFVVEAGSAPGLTNIAVLRTGTSVTSFAIVAPPGRYYVRVRAANEHGTSVPSEEIVLQVL